PSRSDLSRRGIHPLRASRRAASDPFARGRPPSHTRHVDADDLALELALDRTIARVDAAVAAHGRAWAEGGRPATARAASMTDVAVRGVLARAAARPGLAARATPYLAACRLAAVEDDAAVAAARAVAPTWEGLTALTAARAAAARRLGAVWLDLVREAI